MHFIFPFLSPLATAVCQFMEEVGGDQRVQEWQHTQRVPAGRSQLAALQLVQQVFITHRRTHIL